jgi:hypothetical protein
MVLGAALIKQTENKCCTYFQGITVFQTFQTKENLSKRMFFQTAKFVVLENNER